MSKWPKPEYIFNKNEKKVAEEFMIEWQKILPLRYTLLEKFNHGYPVKIYNKLIRKNKKLNTIKTLEIGSGLGEHIKYEDLTCQIYYANELRENMASQITLKYPDINVVIADCQKNLLFADKFFDRIIAIHVLEHLRDLPNALKELSRLLKDDGFLTVVLPCEGGMMYSFARNISTRRIFEKKYKMKYDWWIKSEHVNEPSEIIDELSKYFKIIDSNFFPFKIESFNLNLVFGLTLKKI